MTNQKYFYGVGRRKRASARAKYYQVPGNLEINVNKIPLNEYFNSFYAQTILNTLNNAAITEGKIDLFINGGGTMGQSEAAKLAIAKALVALDEGHRPILRLHGYLTTDNRKVAPKHAGLRKNRKREQWSKR